MDISNTQSLIIGVFISLVGWGLKSAGYDIPGYLAISVGVVGIIFVFLYNHFASKHESKGNNANRTIVELGGRISNLYNQTGVFVQESFHSQVSSSGSKSPSLHRSFEDFVVYIIAIKLSIPQELEVRVMSFFDLLLDYKKQADLLVDSSKSNECYARWMDLKQRFDDDVAPRYSELEVRFRKLLKKGQPT